MRVQYGYQDDSGEYDIVAEVSPTGKVSITSITDEYGSDIDIEDFSDAEVARMGYLAKEEADELNNLPDRDDDDDDLDSDDDLPLDY
jgi:hypothetical protein